ncbi:MAG: carboxylesterase [Gemmatimonadaceae bacterium]|nr:carboxylesterase [Gemmatimonadaceae bacterium]
MDGQQSADTAPIIRGAQTIDLQEEGSPGVLLLHGFGDTPQTLALLARRLHKSGFSVYVPLLPGHGRNMNAFEKSRATDWISAARNALADMRLRHESVCVVGLSMGGALAVTIAADLDDVPALVLIAPYVGMPRMLRLAASVHWAWERFAGEVNSRDPRSIHDPIERERNLAYGAITGRALFELRRVVKLARKSLSLVKAPTLIIQSREDPRCAPEVAEFAFRTLGAQEKKLLWTEGAGHIITVDYGREHVFTEVEQWLKAHTDRGAATAIEGKRLPNAPKVKSDPGRTP